MVILISFVKMERMLVEGGDSVLFIWVPGENQWTCPSLLPPQTQFSHPELLST